MYVVNVYLTGLIYILYTHTNLCMLHNNSVTQNWSNHEIIIKIIASLLVMQFSLCSMFQIIAVVYIFLMLWIYLFIENQAVIWSWPLDGGNGRHTVVLQPAIWGWSIMGWSHSCIVGTGNWFFEWRCGGITWWGHGCVVRSCVWILVWWRCVAGCSDGWVVRRCGCLYDMFPWFLGCLLLRFFGCILFRFFGYLFPASTENTIP